MPVMFTFLTISGDYNVMLNISFYISGYVYYVYDVYDKKMNKT